MVSLTPKEQLYLYYLNIEKWEWHRLTVSLDVIKDLILNDICFQLWILSKDNIIDPLTTQWYITEKIKWKIVAAKQKVWPESKWEKVHRRECD